MSVSPRGECETVFVELYYSWLSLELLHSVGFVVGHAASQRANESQSVSPPSYFYTFCISSICASFGSFRSTLNVAPSSPPLLLHCIIICRVQLQPRRRRRLRLRYRARSDLNDLSDRLTLRARSTECPSNRINQSFRSGHKRISPSPRQC